MFFATIVLVMAQSCIPTEPTGGNPTPTLSGKIKNIVVKNFMQLPFSTTLIRVNYEVKFNYDSLARVNSIYSRFYWCDNSSTNNIDKIY